MLVCLAYPELKPEDAEVIANHRSLHDRPYCDMVGAHWTLVFPTPDVSVDDMERHLLQVARRTLPIDFTVRYSMVHDDDFNSDFYVFLVPDEGFSSICRLHDDLYSGFMAPHRRVDLPYVPHIGIATNKDPKCLKRLANEWNTIKREIVGRISEICLCEYDGTTVTELRTFSLCRS